MLPDPTDVDAINIMVADFKERHRTGKVDPVPLKAFSKFASKFGGNYTAILAHTEMLPGSPYRRVSLLDFTLAGVENLQGFLTAYALMRLCQSRHRSRSRGGLTTYFARLAGICLFRIRVYAFSPTTIF